MTRIDNCSEQFFRIQGVVIFEINCLQSSEFEMDDSFLGFRLNKTFTSLSFFFFRKDKMRRIDNCSEQFFRIQGVVIFEINYLQSSEFKMDNSFLGFRLNKTFTSLSFFSFERMK